MISPRLGFLFSLFVSLQLSCRHGDEASTLQDSFQSGENNDPNFFEIYGKLQYNFDVLKETPSGSVTRQPWSDTYWPNSEGGITVRWRIIDPKLLKERFAYSSPFSEKLINNMTADQINRLSPAEKYDIVTGGYSRGWPMWQREAKLTTGITENNDTSDLPVRTLPKGIRSKDWEGKCHAWTPASLHFAEPRSASVETTRTDGSKVTVHFGSSDIKALLIIAYDMFLGQYPDYARVGNRCEKNFKSLGAGSASPCFDTNAGSFFVLSTNMLRPDRLGFVIDVDPGTQVWNQPVWRYRHKIKDNYCPIQIKKKAKGTVSLAYVETELDWVGELVASEQPYGLKSRIETSNYQYCLELDANRNVIGGSWVSHLRPDFLWMTSRPDFSKPITDTRTHQVFDFKPVLDIFESSLKN